uniref:Peptide deformylase n=1 Tax=Zonotrichia albicollis TaxID=44394 RepID=A0A8D2MAR7_ZONAL
MSREVARPKPRRGHLPCRQQAPSACRWAPPSRSSRWPQGPRASTASGDHPRWHRGWCGRDHGPAEPAARGTELGWGQQPQCPPLPGTTPTHLLEVRGRLHLAHGLHQRVPDDDADVGPRVAIGLAGQLLDVGVRQRVRGVPQGDVDPLLEPVGTRGEPRFQPCWGAATGAVCGAHLLLMAESSTQGMLVAPSTRIPHPVLSHLPQLSHGSPLFPRISPQPTATGAGVDELGVPVSWEASGWAARIIQHEMDHLDGILYIDRMDPRTFTNVGWMELLD